MGIVQDGHGKMYPDMKPWSAFGEEKTDRYFIQCPALLVCYSDYEFVYKRTSCPDQSVFKFVRMLATGFCIGSNSVTKRHDCLKRHGIARRIFAHYPSNVYHQLKDELRKHIDFLENLLSKTKNLQTYDNILIKELINNARRRIEDQRFDDAAARIYRALELYGQICFEKKIGSSNDKVKPGKIPDQLRDEFNRKYLDPQLGLMKLPLQATFAVLRVAGHEAGIRFFSFEDKIKNIQIARNKSILAHGIQPVTEHAARSILDTVTDFVQMKEFFDFPKL